jgi:type IV pilus assembly protein PilP
VNFTFLVLFALFAFWVSHRVQVDLMAKAHAQQPVLPNMAPQALPLPQAAPAPQPIPPSDAPIAVVTPPVPEFIYDPTGKRDPFKPFYRIERLDNLNINAQPSVLSFLNPNLGNKEALETFELSTFQLVAVVWEVSDPKAMLKAPNGKIYTVRKQTRVGRNNGYVATIREGEIVVVEISPDGKTPSTRVLTLQK